MLAGSYEENESGGEALKVIRGPLLVRQPVWKRLVSWAAFTLRFLGVILTGRYRLTVVTTNPPFCPLVLGVVNLVLHRPYLYIVYDIYPDVLARMGNFRKDSLIYRILLKLNVLAMRKASAVVTLGVDMAGHLQDQVEDGLKPEIEVITSWADSETYRPMPKEANTFVIKHGLQEKFVVMYSGAFGATHDMDSILTAAERLRQHEDIMFVLIGKGTRFPEIERQIQRSDLPNVILLPWQPLSDVPASLAAADCHIVSLDAIYSGISFPSKFYTSISVGAPVLAVAQADTDLAAIVESERVGISVRPKNVDDLVSAINRLHEDRLLSKEMGLRGRKLAETKYDEAVCTGQYLDLIERIV